MKLVTKVTTLFAAVASLAMLASCGSSGEAAAAAAPAESVAATPRPAAPDSIPTFEFTGSELVIQVEEMLTDEMYVSSSSKPECTNGWYATIANNESVAECMVKFPAGTYEGLVNEDAPDGNHDAFNVCVDGKYYRTFPSDPPIGTFEWTTRTPMKLVFDADTTVKVQIVKDDPNKPNKPGETGMALDCIKFTKK